MSFPQILVQCVQTIPNQGLLSLDNLTAPLLPLLHAPLVDLCLAEAQALEKLKALHCTAAKPKTLVRDDAPDLSTAFKSFIFMRKIQ